MRSFPNESEDGARLTSQKRRLIGSKYPIRFAGSRKQTTDYVSSS